MFALGQAGCGFGHMGRISREWAPPPSAATTLLGGEQAGFTFVASDQSAVIVDPFNTVNNYFGELSAKLGSIRTSAATCYLASGLLGWGPENLLLRSGDVSNAAWTKTSVTVTDNVAVAPDGTTSFDKVIPAAAATLHHLTQSLTTTAHTTTVSFYAKADGYNHAYIGLYDNAGSPVNTFGWFNLATGAIGTTQAGATLSMVSLGGGVYRCIYVLATAYNGAGNTVTIGVANADNTLSFTGDGTSGVQIWGAQVERAASASTYKPTTSAAYYGLRLDYDPRLSGSPGYLVEEARTNLVIQSNTFTTSWSKSPGTTLTSGQSGPAGNTAYLFTGDAASAAYELYQAVTVVDGTTYTHSIYAKAGSTNWIVLNAADTVNRRTYFNLSNGTVGTNAAGTTAAIVSVGNGWYRCSISRAMAGATSTFFELFLASADGDNTTSGNATVYVFGAQLEAGAFATSYIPTTTATVTRAADIASIAGTLFPLNQAQGTLYAKANAMAAGANHAGILSLTDGTANEIIYSWRNTGTLKATFTVVDGGSNTAQFTSTANMENLASAKIAGAYKLDDSAVVFYGESPQTDVSCTMPTTTTLYFGNRDSGLRSLNGWLLEAKYIPRRASNSELTAMTA